MGQGKSTTAQAPTGPGVEAYKEFAAPAATALANTEFTPYTGSFAPGMSDYTTQAGQLYGDIAQMGQMTPQDYAARTQANMNPYQSNVIDTSLARMGRQQEQARTASEANMIGSGAFGGGGRRAVYEAEFDTGNLANQNQLIAQMMQQGYGQAQAQTMAQIQQQQGALGAGAAGLSGVGATDTALQGAQMAGDYGEFMRQQDDPYNKLNAFTALASGSPTGATSTETYKPGLFEYLKVAAQAAS
jgi:hypothetical protein